MAMKMNLPNKLTVLRVCLVPVFMAVMFIPFNKIAQCLIGAAIFGLTALTDMLDGKIARKRNLITDFGKFLDPVADKIMIFGAFAGLTVMNFDDKVFIVVLQIAAFVFFFRETAVTSMRMIVGTSSGVVIAANMLGKIKTVSQIIFVLCSLLEPVIWEIIGLEELIGTGYIPVLSYVSLIFMTFMTIWSGISYFKSYIPYIDPEK